MVVSVHCHSRYAIWVIDWGRGVTLYVSGCNQKKKVRSLLKNIRLSPTRTELIQLQSELLSEPFQWNINQLHLLLQQKPSSELIIKSSSTSEHLSHAAPYLLFKIASVWNKTPWLHGVKFAGINHGLFVLQEWERGCSISLWGVIREREACTWAKITTRRDC